MNLEYSIEKDDLNILQDTIYKRFALRKKDNFLSTYILITIYSLIILSFTFINFKIYCGFIFNNTFDNLIYLLSTYNGFTYMVILIIISIILTFGTLLLPFLVPVFKNNSCKKGFNILVNKFSISIKENILILEAKTIKLKIPLVKGNIKIKGNTLFLFDNDKFLSIIPLSKVNDKKLLLENINKYVEVIEYDL